MQNIHEIHFLDDDHSTMTVDANWYEALNRITHTT